MSIVVIGANHRTAPLELLERMVIPAERVPKYLHALAEAPDVSEAVVLATCNRTEVYLVAERFHNAYSQVRDFFCDLTFLAPDEFADSLYMYHDEQALRHLFEVSAGLDSAVTGEHEILGQVKRAWEVARESGTATRGMNMVFRHAVESGKRARSETRIAHHVTSVSQAAVILAGRHFIPTGTADASDGGVSDGEPCAGSAAAQGLAGKRAVVLGAGSMAKGIAGFLAAANVSELLIVNRSVQRAESLAETTRIQNDSVDITSAGLEALESAIRGADVILTATRAQEPLISGDLLSGRDGSELLIVDVGMPRNVRPEVSELHPVTLLDMDDVAALTEAGMAARRAETDAVGRIVDEELRRFQSIVQAREAAPVIASLRSMAEALRVSELERHSTALAELSPTQVEAVDAVTRAVLAKLLHEPSVRLRDSAGSGRGERLAESIRDLFDLD